MLFDIKKVLVCDDQPMLRSLLTSAITCRAPQYEVIQVVNGLEAEEAIKTQEFEIVFLDVQMPEQDGFTTLQHIRTQQLQPDTPVVFCTGCVDQEHRVRGWQLRADYYLTKPFDLDEINEVIDDIVEKKRLKKAAVA